MESTVRDPGVFFYRDSFGGKMLPMCLYEMAGWMRL